MHSFRMQTPNPFPIDVAATNPSSFVGKRDGQINENKNISPDSVSLILEIPVQTKPNSGRTVKNDRASFSVSRAGIHRHHRGII